MSKKSRLTIKQQAFADFYIELGNATQAAIKAGYSKRSARQIGEQNLSKHDIKAYIQKKQEALKSERVADQQEILEYLTSILRGEQTEGILRGIGDGVQEIDEIEVSAKDRIKAAELLGKRYLMWTEKHQMEADMQVTIVDDIPVSDNNEK